MEKKKTSKFKRTDFSKYSKLGVRRKKKQVYRKPKGIDNKIKLKMKGHLRKVMVGFKNNSKTRKLINGLRPVLIFNKEDLNKIGKEEIGIVAKVGRKKKIEISELVLNKNIRLLNLNARKFLDKVKEDKKIKDEKKDKKEKKIKEEGRKEREIKEKDKKEVNEKEKLDEEKEKINEEKDKKEVKEEELDNEKEKKSEEKKTENLEVKNNKDFKDKNVEKSKKEPQTNNYGRGK